jgi:glycosyltransferase involved in cell wall biosynthesis
MAECGFQPRVSIILPVYNGEAFVERAVQSALSQTMTDFELLILDDGSTDNTLDLIQTLQDTRIQTYHHDNMGLSATLNRGISLARGRYIARLDHDDLMLSSRLQKQCDYLDAHPEVALLGTAAQIYEGKNPTTRFHRHPTSNKALQLRLLFDNPFVHASIMFRREAIQEIGGYCTDKRRLPPEDYELWSRVARVHDIANLTEVLTIYREVPGSLSRVDSNPFIEKVLLFSAENLHAVLSPDFTLQDCRFLAAVYHGVDGATSRMPRHKALQMLRLATLRIGEFDCNAEFTNTQRAMTRLMKHRYARRYIPNAALAWLRSMRKRFGA